MNDHLGTRKLRLLGLGLALLLAVAAFAGVAGVAEATAPHWYKNGTRLKEESGKQCKEPTNCTEESPGEHTGEGLPFMGWGTFVLETKTIGTLSCQTEFGGQVWNPTGGLEPGYLSVRAYSGYNCVNESCEAGFKSKPEWIAEGLGANEGTKEFGQWLGVLYEPSPGVIRFKLGNTELGSPTQIKILLACKNRGYEFHVTGELTPKLVNASVIGSPAKLEFGTGSGELDWSGLGKEGKFFESLKLMGYQAGEVLAARNP